jgi:hypothetical protein
VTESVKQFVGCDLPDSSPPAGRVGRYLVNVSFRAVLVPFDCRSRQQGNVRNLSIAIHDRKEPLFAHRSIIPELPVNPLILTRFVTRRLRCRHSLNRFTRPSFFRSGYDRSKSNGCLLRVGADHGGGLRLSRNQMWDVGESIYSTTDEPRASGKKHPGTEG